MIEIDGPGLRLSRSYFHDVVEPIVATVAPGLRYGAALIGPGSEVLGFDTEMSPDHDFGPRVLLFLDDSVVRPAVAAALERQLPASFAGRPTRFPLTHDVAGGAVHRVVLTDVGSWCRGHLGIDVSARPPRPVEWLGLPWQRLAEATAGAVFRDDQGTLTALRATLAWYPDDVWRYVLAGQWLRISQEEPFVGRAGIVDDDLGSSVLAARLVRDVMRLALLLARAWPPYAKWLGTAFARLPDAGVLAPMLRRALRAGEWREREAALCEAYEHCARTQNALGLAAAVDPTCRSFWDRPLRVLGAERFSDALFGAISDPEVAALARIGNVDTFVDSTDVLADPARSLAATAVLSPS
ncbi:MAG TPA: DUF4037 domain-containing protein [Micromonosporaceae bacterium]|jgi:hypothetical protein